MNRKKLGRPTHLQKIKALQEEALSKELQASVDICYSLLHKEEDKTLHATAQRVSDAALLSPSTVTRLWRGQTRYPRYLTVQKIADAAGLKLTTERGKVRVSLAHKHKQTRH